MSIDRPIKPLRYRQIHLDFHTSEHIPGVGAQFDAQDFVATLKAAHVNSVTIFAKCHHGWCYYPTKVGFPHPQLARPDLMGEMVEALTAADIECPIYITVQWDERTAHAHQEWRVVSAINSYHHQRPDDPSTLKQLSPAWHTICLNHPEYREHVLELGREVARDYPTQGLFFDIVGTHECVCEACLKRMHDNGLDPLNPADRRRNDEEVNENFRREVSTALFQGYPNTRIFYNFGHIPKQGPKRYWSYTHLEIESLPTGGWGYDHFPANARYAAALGYDFLGQTGKFHTSWGEFGGFKHPHALEYEIMQMAALGAKSLVGDQLHPSGAINHDTYRTIAPAYARLEQLEPYLVGARQVSTVAILSAEHFHPEYKRNHESDDGAAQVLLELKQPFDVIDGLAEFGAYELIILPDDIPVDAQTTGKLDAYVGNGGKLLVTGRSGLDPQGGDFALDIGATKTSDVLPFEPSYIRATPALKGAGLPESPFVAYAQAVGVTAGAGAEVLAEIVPPYFNRSYRHFSSHQHTPDDVEAAPLGAAALIKGNVGYIAYPIFRLYHDMGQPLYKYLVKAMLDRLLPETPFTTDLPSSGRASLTRQQKEGRHILHLLYGAPQVRGKGVRNADGTTRFMEMIEDLPALGPVSARVRLPKRPTRVYDAATGEDVDWSVGDDGKVAVQLPGLHIHRALVFEGT